MKKIFLVVLVGLGCAAFALPAYGALGAELITNGGFGSVTNPDLSGWTPKNCQIRSAIFSYKNYGANLYNRTSTDSYISQGITAALNANGGGLYVFEASFNRMEDPNILKDLHLSVTQSVPYGLGTRTYIFHVYDSYIQAIVPGPNGGTRITKVKGLVELKWPCRSASVKIQPGTTKQGFMVDRISLCKLLPDPGVIKPFPQQSPGIVLDPLDRNNVITIYEQWKERYLKTSAKDPSSMYVGQTQYYDYAYEEDGYDLHGVKQYKPTARGYAIATSEGMGYGMLISVIMAGYDGDAKKNFDALLYTVEKFKSIMDGQVNPNLMSWVVPVDENPASCSDSATDGDLDIAYSLLLAYKQWGVPAYLDKAKARINAIKKDCVLIINDPIFTGLLKIGNWQTSEKFSRTSDWMLDHFKAFKALAGIDFDGTINFIINALTRRSGGLNTATGLLPDFTEGYNVGVVVAADCLSYYYAYDGVNFYKNNTFCEIESKNDGRYFYNACRYPWRFAVDFLHTRNLKTKDQLCKVMEFFKSTLPGQLNCGYDLNGVPLQVLGDSTNKPENQDLGYYETGSLTFVAPVAAAYAVYTRRYNSTTYRGQYQAYWDYIKNKFENDYFSDSINLLCMMTATGNWWNPGISQ